MRGGRVALAQASFRFSGIPEFGNRNSEAGGSDGIGPPWPPAPLLSEAEDRASTSRRPARRAYRPDSGS